MRPHAGFHLLTDQDWDCRSTGGSWCGDGGGCSCAGGCGGGCAGCGDGHGTPRVGSCRAERDPSTVSVESSGTDHDGQLTSLAFPGLRIHAPARAGLLASVQESWEPFRDRLLAYSQNSLDGGIEGPTSHESKFGRTVGKMPNEQPTVGVPGEGSSTKGGTIGGPIREGHDCSACESYYNKCVSCFRGIIADRRNYNRRRQMCIDGPCTEYKTCVAAQSPAVQRTCPSISYPPTLPPDKPPPESETRKECKISVFCRPVKSVPVQILWDVLIPRYGDDAMHCLLKVTPCKGKSRQYELLTQQPSYGEWRETGAWVKYGLPSNVYEIWSPLVQRMPHPFEPGAMSFWSSDGHHSYELRFDYEEKCDDQSEENTNSKCECVLRKANTYQRGRPDQYGVAGFNAELRLEVQNSNAYIRRVLDRCGLNVSSVSCADCPGWDVDRDRDKNLARWFSDDV